MATSQRPEQAAGEAKTIIHVIKCNYMYTYAWRLWAAFKFQPWKGTYLCAWPRTTRYPPSRVYNGYPEALQSVIIDFIQPLPFQTLKPWVQRLVEDHETRKGQTSLMEQINASNFQRGSKGPKGVYNPFPSFSKQYLCGLRTTYPVPPAKGL